MKTILISFLITAVCFTAQAGKKSYQYVITDGDTLICKNIRIGYANTRCVILSGEKKIISNEDINVISKTTNKGKMVYFIEKKPVYLNNKSTGKNALMKLVDVQKGVRIYKYEYFNDDTESMDLVLSFYQGDKLLKTQTNPNILQVYEFVDHYTYKCENKELYTSKQF